MGLFSRTSSQASKPPNGSRSRSSSGKVQEPNVLYNPNAYLATGGGDVDRGAMMAQQAATRTHQLALAANQKRQENRSALKSPIHYMPKAARHVSTVNRIYSEEIEQAVGHLSFEGYDRVNRMSLSELRKPGFQSLFEEFGMTPKSMQYIFQQWDHGYEFHKRCLLQLYKKESKIPASAWATSFEEFTGAAARYASRLYYYNGIAVAVTGDFDQTRTSASLNSLFQ